MYLVIILFHILCYFVQLGYRNPAGAVEGLSDPIQSNLCEPFWSFSRLTDPFNQFNTYCA